MAPLRDEDAKTVRPEASECGPAKQEEPYEPAQQANAWLHARMKKNKGSDESLLSSGSLTVSFFSFLLDETLPVSKKVSTYSVIAQTRTGRPTAPSIRGHAQKRTAPAGAT